MRDEHPDEADRRPRHLAVEDVVRAVALGRLDGRRRRQHHHQAEHHEHGDDDADHVVGDRRRPALDVPQPTGAVVGAGRARRRAGRRAGTWSAPPCSRSSASRRRSATDAPAPADASARAWHRRVASSCCSDRCRVVRARGGGSRRRGPGSRRRGTSRSWRSPATAARRRRVGPAAPARSTASAIDAAVTTGAAPANVAATTSAASPMATTARSRVGLGGHRRQVEPLVQPAGDQHDVVERPDRHRRGVRRRRLGVVVPAHAAGVADELDAVRRADERRQPGGDRVGPDEPGLEHERGGGEPVGEVVGQRPAQRGDRRRARPAGRRSIARRRRGSRRRSGRTCGGGPGAAREVGHHDGIGGEADGDVVGPLLAEDPRLGGLVGGHRGVPVEVVGRQVEPRRGVAAERARSTPAGSSCTRRRRRRRRGRAPRRAARRCCRRRPTRTPPAREHLDGHSVVVVLPSVPVTASIGRGPPGRSCSHR